MCDEAISETDAAPHRLPCGPLHDASEVARFGIRTAMVFIQSLRSNSKKVEDARKEYLELAVIAFGKLDSELCSGSPALELAGRDCYHRILPHAIRVHFTFHNYLFAFVSKFNNNSSTARHMEPDYVSKKAKSHPSGQTNSGRTQSRRKSRLSADLTHRLARNSPAYDIGRGLCFVIVVALVAIVAIVAIFRGNRFEGRANPRGLEVLSEPKSSEQQKELTRPSNEQ